MAWSYHKHIKMIPDVLLHIGKKGVSTSIVSGLAGMSPKTGGPLPRIPSQGNHSSSSDNIFSADIHEITSPGMQGVKEAILVSYNQQLDLRRDLEAVRRTARRSRLQLRLSRLFLYGIINRSFSRKIENDITSQDVAIQRIAEQIAASVITLRIDFESETIRQQYQRVVHAFKELIASRKIWDVTSAHYQDRIAARSSASTVVNKREVRFGFRSVPGISTELEVLYFQNANGADLYFYPGFIVMQAAPGNFALIDIDELQLSHGAVRFTETGPVPADSAIIDQTWAKVNKNGTPDRRFKSNYQIPIVRYGELRLKTATGLHEEYECSNYEATEAFGLAFGAYQRLLRLLRDESQGGWSDR